MKKAAGPQLGGAGSGFWIGIQGTGYGGAMSRARASRSRAQRGRQDGQGLGSLRLPALNAGLDGRVPRAARSVLTARFRRAAPHAVLTCTQCPRRLRRLRTKPLPALPRGRIGLLVVSFGRRQDFWGRGVAIDGPSRAIDCGREAVRCEGRLDRSAPQNRHLYSRLNWLQSLQSSPRHGGSISEHRVTPIGASVEDSRRVKIDAPVASQGWPV